MITIKLKLSRFFALNNKIIVYGACFQYREIDYFHAHFPVISLLNSMVKILGITI